MRNTAINKVINSTKENLTEVGTRRRSSKNRPLAPSRGINSLFQPMCSCEPLMKASMKRSDSITVVMKNKDSPAKKTKDSQCTPSKKRVPKVIVTPKRNSAPPSAGNGTIYHSPESIRLRLPTSSSSSKEPASPPSLFRSPEKLWKTLACAPAKAPKGRTNKENNNWTGQWMDKVAFGCGDSSCVESMATPSGSAFSARLTPDLLKQHERTSPARTLHFSGDKLAKTVLDKKTQQQLAKQQREKALLGLEQEKHADPQENPIAPKAQDIKTKQWIEQERQKALAAAWQRKKQEQWESMRAEQLRLAELERQRNLRSPPKKGEKVNGSHPSTPRAHHRKLIHI